MVYFCPRCWSELRREERACPRCNTDVELFSAQASYVEKLVAALDHPEAQTPIRAAWVLGKLRAVEAVPALIRIVQESADRYLVEAAVEALGQIGDPNYRATLELAACEGAHRVRRAAEKALRRLENGASQKSHARGV